MNLSFSNNSELQRSNIHMNVYIHALIQVHIAIFIDCNCFINTVGSHLYIPATPATSLLIDESIGDFREQTCSKCKHEYTRTIMWRRHIMRAVQWNQSIASSLYMKAATPLVCEPQLQVLCWNTVWLSSPPVNILCLKGSVDTGR